MNVIKYELTVTILLGGLAGWPARSSYVHVLVFMVLRDLVTID